MIKITKIVSGGQTGADRGGLDAAIEAGIPHGGWCPAGRIAEDGVIPDKYNQQELYSKNYAHRTEQNIIDSDATVIFTYNIPQGGSKLTVILAEKHNKPYLWIDLNEYDNVSAAGKIKNWLNTLPYDQIILNIAGSRGSSYADIQIRVCEIMKSVIN